MKRLALALGCLCVSVLGGFAQDKEATPAATNAPAKPIRIPAIEAKNHLNETAIVTGTVAEVSKSERVVRLNLEKPFPDHAMNAIIFSDKTNLFPEVDKFKGKTVEVTGKIVEYRGKPEIILTATNQLNVVEKAAEPDKK
jgi:DNA/RNA endonuclease YhcR with UshA esterase domain